MIEPTMIKLANAEEFLQRLISASTSASIEALLSELPIREVDDFEFRVDSPTSGWREGSLHWIPVGRDRGNAGRIKLANRPINPPVERTINGMEALIELERRRELVANSSAPPPSSPREAIHRYYGLPPLDQLPDLTQPIGGLPPRRYARELARKILMELQ